jgi:soluble lytic murein transglycosylase-like protein
MDLVTRGIALLLLLIALTARNAMASADVEAALDRWRPLVDEAAHRFGIPAPWIRDVMRLESAGQAFIDGKLTTSCAGAMGLMQVMPATYAELRKRYGFGTDPYDPHDNIFAGAAYLRELYERYGWPSLFAAYHAGPTRFETYLSTGQPLPEATRNYLAALVPERSTNGRPAGSPLSVATIVVPLSHAPRVAELKPDSLLDERLFVRLRAAGRIAKAQVSNRDHVAAGTSDARDP